MNPVIVIPTFVGAQRRSLSLEIVGTYDHTTPLNYQGELPRCLRSLCEQGIKIPVILLVAAEAEVTAEAGDKIRSVAAAFANQLSIQVIDAPIAERLQDRLAELGADALIEGIGLRGYSALRNLGIVAAAVRGFTELIFIDDDEIVTSPDFLEQATYGLGKLSPKGVPILVKSGFYTDQKGNWRADEARVWYNRFWTQGKLFNQWMEAAMSRSRLSPSNILNGGCFALHREAFIRIAFDPWISRGEDLDYLLNVLMYGGQVWFDNQWSVCHIPPMNFAEGQRFRQDIYRWSYENRKLEYAKSQIDLLQVQPSQLDPYPGPFLERSVNRRALITALLRTIGRPRDRQGYLKAALAAPRDARAYALEFCGHYFDFQRLWANLIEDLEHDLISQQILRAGLAEPRPGADLD